MNINLILHPGTSGTVSGNRLLQSLIFTTFTPGISLTRFSDLHSCINTSVTRRIYPVSERDDTNSFGAIAEQIVQALPSVAIIVDACWPPA